MKLTHLFVRFSAVLFGLSATACAYSVDVAEFAPLDPEFAELPNPVAGDYDLQIRDGNSLLIHRKGLGHVCSGVMVSGDFRQPFEDYARAALDGAFEGHGADEDVTRVSLAPRVADVRILHIGRSDFEAVARVSLAVEIEGAVTRGAFRRDIAIDPDATHVEVEERSGLTCDSGARALSSAMHRSMTLALGDFRERALEALRRADGNRAQIN